MLLKHALKLCFDLFKSVREQRLGITRDGSFFGDCRGFSRLWIITVHADFLKGKIKVQLKLSISRLRMVQQKDTAIAKQQRRAMAVLLEVRIHSPCLSASS